MAGDELPPLDNRYHRGILSCAAVYEPPWPAYRQVRSHNNYPTIENSPLWKKKRRETLITYVFLQWRTSTTWAARSDSPKVCPNQTNWEEFRLYRHHSINVWSSIKLTVFFLQCGEPPPTPWLCLPAGRPLSNGQGDKPRSQRSLHFQKKGALGVILNLDIIKWWRTFYG